MFDLIQKFPDQLEEALQLGEKARLTDSLCRSFKNVLVCGLGGSGIGGDLLAELFRTELPIPVLVHKGYFLPAFVDAGSLLILSSYSGNTEETIALAKQAKQKGLHAVCITSGGKLRDLATAFGWDIVLIPSGFPPRACLGYSFVQLLFVLQHAGLSNESLTASVRGAAALLRKEQTSIKETAQKLAGRLLHKILIVYAEDKYAATALRLKQQINENAKMHCWYNVFPEVNHNELVGWKQAPENIAVLFLRTDDEYERNTQRIGYTQQVIGNLSENTAELKAKGNNGVEKHFYLIHCGDWLSYYLAEQQHIDPVEVDVITRLKQQLEAFGNS